MYSNSMSLFWRSSRGKIAGLMVSVCIACCFSLVRLSGLPPVVCFVYRSFFCLPVYFMIGFYQIPTFFSVIRKNWLLLGARSIVDALGVGLYYLSAAYFPLTELGFIVQTQTVYTMLWAFIILRE